MINKKIGVMTLGLTLMMLASCGPNSNKGNYVPPKAEGSDNITYFCPSTDVKYMEEVVAAFKAANPDYTGEITLQAEIGEGDVKAEVQKDINAAADVVLLADDNVRSLVGSRGLVQWTPEETEYMVEHNGESMVSAMQINGKTYGIPYRGDNGYQVIYDKTLVTADDVKSLEGLLAKAKQNGYYVGYNLSEGWYVPAPFFANGVKLEFNEEGKFETDINGEKGLQAIRAMSDLWVEYGGTTWLDTSAPDNFGPAATTRKCAQIIWNATTQIAGLIGEENVGVAQLPTLKINGVDKQLHTYAGVKGVAVVNKENMPDSKKATAKAFALFIASTEMQEKRLVDLGQGVTDKAVVAKTELWSANPFLNSLAAQQNAGAAQVQANHANGAWWENSKIMMTNVTAQDKNNPLTDAQLQAALDACATAISE